ncbi:MAG: hypothetical protein M3165_00040 [Actinomycetota bacterium]|nr:hypothetical protein [Actinomycetota bacterium]
MRFSIRRSLALASVAGLAATALVSASGSANAVVVPGGGRNPDRTPVYVRDAEGIALQLCSDTVYCEPADTAAGDIGAYFGAEAALGPMRAIWGIDAAYLEAADGTVSDVPALTSSALFRAEGLRPNRRYTIRGPWGTHRCMTNAEGELNNKNCLFERGGEAGGRLRSGPVKSFLYSPLAPRGFVGGLEIPQRVTGSPSGFNRVTLDGPGAHFRTNMIALSGQMADDTPMSQISKTALRMGNKRNTAPVTRILRYRSIGTAPATFRVRRGGENPVAFKVRENCAAVAPGRVCRIEVIYRPGAHDKSAFLTITDNTMAHPRRVTLRGVAPVR